MTKANYSVNIKIQGTQKVKDRLKVMASLKSVKSVVDEDSKRAKQIMLRNENFVKGYSTGATKASTSATIFNSGLSAEIGVTTEYAPFVETGTRFMESEEFARPTGQEMGAIFPQDIQKAIGNE